MTEMENPIKILIVDDEQGTALAIRKLLQRRFSAEVDLACDCATTREKLETGKYDLITLDYQLPDGDGLEIRILLKDERCPNEFVWTVKKDAESTFAMESLHPVLRGPQGKLVYFAHPVLTFINPETEDDDTLHTPPAWSIVGDQLRVTIDRTELDAAWAQGIVNARLVL